MPDNGLGTQNIKIHKNMEYWLSLKDNLEKMMVYAHLR